MARTKVRLTKTNAAALRLRVVPWRVRPRRLPSSVIRKNASNVLDFPDDFAAMFLSLGVWLMLVLGAPVITFVLAVMLLPFEATLVAIIAAGLLAIRFRRSHSVDHRPDPRWRRGERRSTAASFAPSVAFAISTARGGLLSNSSGDSSNARSPARWRLRPMRPTQCSPRHHPHRHANPLEATARRSGSGADLESAGHGGQLRQVARRFVDVVEFNAQDLSSRGEQEQPHRHARDDGVVQ
jgi:hypothetical protein